MLGAFETDTIRAKNTTTASKKLMNIIRNFMGEGEGL